MRYADLDAATPHTAIEGLLEADILTVPLDAELMKTALDLALEHDLTLHDAGRSPPWRSSSAASW